MADQRARPGAAERQLGARVVDAAAGGLASRLVITIEAMQILPPVTWASISAWLERLAGVSPELAQLVERRYFAGLTVEQIAELDGSSPATVKRRWRAARAWLQDALGGAA